MTLHALQCLIFAHSGILVWKICVDFIIFSNSFSLLIINLDLLQTNFKDFGKKLGVLKRKRMRMGAKGKKQFRKRKNTSAVHIVNDNSCDKCYLETW